MRYTTFVAVTALGVLGACTDERTSPTAPTKVGALQPAAAATAATQTEFEGFINFCESEPVVRTTPGGTLHLRGENRTQWVTGNPLIDGFEENEPLLNLNLKNGTGVVHLDGTLRPDAVNGTWEIRQTVSVVDFAPAASTGVGHGTGELQGMTIKFSTGPATGRVSACNPEMVSAGVQGVIISSASSS